MFCLHQASEIISTDSRVCVLVSVCMYEVSAYASLGTILDGWVGVVRLDAALVQNLKQVLHHPL